MAAKKGDNSRREADGGMGGRGGNATRVLPTRARFRRLSLSLSPDHHGIALHRPLGAVHELWLGAFTVVDRDGADAMLEQEAPIG
jgi:hypothetical protein